MDSPRALKFRTFQFLNKYTSAGGSVQLCRFVDGILHALIELGSAVEFHVNVSDGLAIGWWLGGAGKDGPPRGGI